MTDLTPRPFTDEAEIVSKGQTLDVQGTSTPYYTVIRSGGTVVVSNGGETVHTKEDYASGGDEGGGNEIVNSGGISFYAVLRGGTVFRGGQIVNSGGIAIGARVLSGGDQDVFGGTSEDTVLSTQNGEEHVQDGGKSIDTTIRDGGLEVVANGGMCIGTGIYAGGLLQLTGYPSLDGNYGISQNTEIFKGGKEEVGDPNQTGGHPNAIGTFIWKGGSQIVQYTGTASGTHIYFGATEIVVNGGTSANATVILGSQNVEDGGKTTGTQIDQGIQNVQAGGVSSGTVVGYLGTENVHGTSVDTQVSLGGNEVVDGGKSMHTTVFQGGVETVLNSGVASDTIINGGLEKIQSGGTAVNVTFSGDNSTHNVLQLADPSELKGTISNWHVGSFIDFVKTAGSPQINGAQIIGNELLVYYDGNKVPATYTLTGQQAHTTLFLGGDGHGGTELFLMVSSHSGAPPLSSVTIQPETIQSDFLAIMQTALPLDQVHTVVESIDAGTLTEAQFVDNLLTQLASPTIAAVAVEGSMYNAVGSSAEITTLVTQFQPPQIENATILGLDPQVYACETLGLAFAFSDENGGTAFATSFGPSNPSMPATAAGDASFAAAAANAIFGSAQNANTPSAILGWVSNWEAFYTAHGIPGIANPTTSQIDLAARGAAWGDAVGVALANNLGSLPEQVTNFLEDAAQGAATYSASLASQPTPAPFEGAASAIGSATAAQLIGVPATPSDPMLAAQHA